MILRLSSAVSPVLVIGGGSVNGLGIARNLGARGIPVYCVTSNPNELTRYSRYCQGTWVIPGIEGDQAVLAQFLATFHRRQPRECVLFPTTDTAALTLAHIQHDLNGYACVMPDPMTVETMVMKSKFYSSLPGSGIAYPVTFDPETVALDTICRTLSFPVFVRPVQSPVYRKYFRGKGFVATSPSSLQYYLDVADHHRVPVLVQQTISGPTDNGFILRGYITRQGTPGVLFAAQKVLQPHMFANPSITITIPLKRLASFVAPFLTYLAQQHFRGLFSAELKRDDKDGQLKLLEVNARSSGDNYIGHACGADDIFTAYLDALKMKLPPQVPYTLGIACIHEFTSLQALLLHAYRGQLSRQNMQWIHRRKYLRTFTRDDLRPMLIEVKHYGTVLRHVLLP